MAILALPLVISALKPHTSRLFLLRAGAPNPSRLCNPLGYYQRHFTKTSVSAISTSAVPQQSSTDQVTEPQKASVLTFQQAIQRLQVTPQPRLVLLSIANFTVYIYIYMHALMNVCSGQFTLDGIVLYGIGILGFSWMRHNAMQQHRGTDWSLLFFFHLGLRLSTLFILRLCSL